MPSLRYLLTATEDTGARKKPGKSMPCSSIQTVEGHGQHRAADSKPAPSTGPSRMKEPAQSPRRKTAKQVSLLPRTPSSPIIRSPVPHFLFTSECGQQQGRLGPIHLCVTLPHSRFSCSAHPLHRMPSKRLVHPARFPPILAPAQVTPPPTKHTKGPLLALPEDTVHTY